MSFHQRERTLEVWAGAQTRNHARIDESVLCIAPQELNRQELNLVVADAHIITCIDEAPGLAGVGHSAVVVYAAGLELARELLLVNALDGTARIHWHLGLGLVETLDTLAGVDLPLGVRVESINHVASGTVVTTSLTTGGMLDTESFHRGVQAGSVHPNGQSAVVQAPGVPPWQATTPNAERLLQEKLLYTLQTMEPLLDAAPSCTGLHDGDAETQLIVLKRKYDALERKYNSLAASQLGKLTLRLWARKSGTRVTSATKAQQRT